MNMPNHGGEQSAATVGLTNRQTPGPIGSDGEGSCMSPSVTRIVAIGNDAIARRSLDGHDSNEILCMQTDTR